jgi:protein tyrosine phosphatase (PTP) superfamily phosphohydrolase (DUF442 family)
MGLLLAILAETVHVLLGGNFHAVIPGEVYRCSQPSPAELETMIKRHGIRTVINLRGCCNPNPWYLDECRITHDLDVAQEDLCFSAGRLPSVAEIRRLVEVLDHTEYPVLFHCYRGSDRTGMASVVAQLLRTDVSLSRARRQLSLRFAHLALGRPANLDRFLDLYSEWLTEQGITHSRATFRRWLLEGYCPGACRCEFAPLDFPTQVAVNEPFTLRVRCRNTSIKPWRLQPEANAGIHLMGMLFDEQGRFLQRCGAGYFDAVVAPGESIDLTLALPAVITPGHYRIQLDMVDEQHCAFCQTGQEPLQWEFEVR